MSNQNTPTNTLEELREQILTEFKQVHKLAPADYTENCTNVVMSMVSQAVNKARLSELEDISICNHFGDYADHILFKGRPENFTIQDRIKELETPKQVEGEV